MDDIYFEGVFMEKVVIFGAGNCGRLIGARLANEANVEILAFIDNDTQKVGQTITFENTLDSIAGGGGGKYLPLYKAYGISV